MLRLPSDVKGVETELMSHCRARELGRSAWTRVRRFFLCLAIHADDHDGFAQLLHAADEVPGAGRAPIPEGEKHVAGLHHLVIPAHTGRLPEALPISAKELMLDLMFPRPAVAELTRAPVAAGDDLRDEKALWCQRLTQELIVGECA